MWLWLSALLILLQSTSYAAPTSLGPTSESEARVLLTEGQAAFQDSRFQDAENLLQRMVDRYPGASGFLQAQLLLGQTLVQVGKTQEAIRPLKDFLSATGTNLDAAKARIGLGHCYLSLKKFNEAHLTTLEIEEMGNRMKLPSDIILEGLLIKAQALLGLNHKTRAINALESAEKQITDKNSPEVKGQAYGLHLKLKAFSCARLPSPDRLTEAQVRDQFDRRGTCLLEALLLFQKILEAGDPRAAGLAVTQVSEAFDAYHKECTHPPVSTHLRRQKKATLEQSRYKTELTDLLVRDCRKKSGNALDLLRSWKEKLPNSMIGSALQASKNIEMALSRNP